MRDLLRVKPSMDAEGIIAVLRQRDILYPVLPGLHTRHHREGEHRRRDREVPYVLGVDRGGQRGGLHHGVAERTVQNVPAGQGDRRREVGRESINTKYPRVTTKIQGGHRREVGREGGREGRRERGRE
jgi:hypothetical protein